jgi:hypothetical protein
MLLKFIIVIDLCVFCVDQEGRTPRHRPAPDRTGRERTAAACSSRRRHGPCHCTHKVGHKYWFPIGASSHISELTRGPPELDQHFRL